MLEKIFDQNVLIGLIIRNNFTDVEGVNFFTEDSSPQQLAYMRHPSGKIIPPHVHNSVLREIHYTSEVLVIKSGIIRVDFYNTERDYLESRMLYSGDIILLSGGGHGFYVVEDAEMVEVKQGPYVGEQDKVRFNMIEDYSIRFKKDTSD